MKKKLFAIGMLMLFAVLFLQGKELKRIDQWRHEGAFGFDFFSIINQNNHIVAGFALTGCRIISPDKITSFGPRGQGPSDLEGFKTAFLFNGDLAVVERPDKMKVLSLKNGTYVWKETKWLKRGPGMHQIKDGIFFDNKFYIAGWEKIYLDDRNSFEYSLLKVYDTKGSPIKQLIREKYTKPNQFYLIKNFVVGCQSDRVLSMSANKLTLYVISSKQLKVVKQVDLEAPSFYKQMPDTFYIWKKYGETRSFTKDYEEWEMGYSSIQEIVVSGNQFVIQIRTADEEKKKFALLFYDLDSFKLVDTIFIDDFLLDEKDGKFYCFANGNPGLDEDTDECVINIYNVVEKK